MDPLLLVWGIVAVLCAVRVVGVGARLARQQRQRRALNRAAQVKLSVVLGEQWYANEYGDEDGWLREGGWYR